MRVLQKTKFLPMLGIEPETAGQGLVPYPPIYRFTITSDNYIPDEGVFSARLNAKEAYRIWEDNSMVGRKTTHLA